MFHIHFFFLIVYIFWSVKIELFFVDCVILENGEILHIKFSWSPSSEVFFCKHDINNVIKQKNKFLTAELLNSLSAH